MSDSESGEWERYGSDSDEQEFKKKKYRNPYIDSSAHEDKEEKPKKKKRRNQEESEEEMEEGFDKYYPAEAPPLVDEEEEMEYEGEPGTITLRQGDVEITTTSDQITRDIWDDDPEDLPRAPVEEIKSVDALNCFDIVKKMESAGSLFKTTYGSLDILFNPYEGERGVMEFEEAMELANKLPTNGFIAKDLKFIVENTTMGSGKSKALDEYIIGVCKHLQRGNLEFPTICSISARMLFSKFSTDRTNERMAGEGILEKMVCYKEATAKEIKLSRWISIQLDSLRRLKTRLKNGFFDFLILDEFVSIMRQISSSTLAGKRLEIVALLLQLMSKAKKVWIMDADIDQLTMNLILHLTKGEEKKLMYSINLGKVDTKEWYIIDNVSQILHFVVDWIEANPTKRFFFPCPSKFMGEVMKAFIERTREELGISEDTKVKLINSFYTEVSGGVADVNSWRDHYVGCSTSMVGGISCEEDFFEITVVVVAGALCTAQEIIQMINRSRKTKKIYVCLLGNSKRTEEKKRERKSDPYFETNDIERLMYRIQEDNSSVLKKELGDSESLLKYNFGYEPDYREFANSAMIKIMAVNEALRMRSVYNMRETFLDLIKRSIVSDEQIHFVPKELNKKKLGLKEMKTFVRESKARQVCNADSVDKRDVPAGELIEYEYWLNRKKSFKEFYNVQNPNVQFIAKWEYRMPNVRLFSLLLLAEEGHLREIDRNIMSNLVGDHVATVQFFQKDIKHLRRFLEICFRDWKKPWTWERFTSDTITNFTELSEINNLISPTRNISLETKKLSSKTIVQKLRIILKCLGLEMEMNRESINQVVTRYYSVDLNSLYEMYKILLQIHKDSPSVMERLQNDIEAARDYYREKGGGGSNTTQNSQAEPMEMTQVEEEEIFEDSDVRAFDDGEKEYEFNQE